MARALNRTVLAGGVLYPTGTPEGQVRGDVPAEFWEGSTGTSAEKGSYGDLTVEQLKDEIRARNEDRDADHLPLTGSKADLVAALESDDAR